MKEKQELMNDRSDASDEWINAIDVKGSKHFRSENITGNVIQSVKQNNCVLLHCNPQIISCTLGSFASICQTGFYALKAQS